MIEIPAGWFVMGSASGHPDEQPPTAVYLSGYAIDRTEVTNEAYQRFVAATGRRSPVYWNGSSPPAGQEDRPVVGVGWQDAADYCAWIGKRLPTEAEWEKACRGPAELEYPWGDTWDPSLANCRLWDLKLEAAWEVLADNEPQTLRAVGSYPAGASGYGALDMAGNAAEWVADWYTWEGYDDVERIDPIGVGPPWNRSIRGSAWLDPHGSRERLADASRCAWRSSSHSYDDPRVGFRCARSATDSGV
jgi:formylglycine-generating enzyme required for sulfatase activity